MNHKKDIENNHNTCPVCESDQLKVLKGYEKDHLVRCKQCKLVFSNRKPTRAELDKIYNAYIRDNNIKTELTLKKLRLIADNLGKVSKAKRVLDIGCGNGAFLTMFKKIGCEVYVTEFNKSAEDVCRSKGIKMLSGGLMPQMESNLSDKFDLVILTEVIEHVNNPRDIINNISDLLKKNGYLYITTPNYFSIDRLIMGPQWGMICYPEHLILWNPKTLDQFLRTCGYEKIFIRTENISFFRIVQYLNKKKYSLKLLNNDPEKAAAIAQIKVNQSKFFFYMKNIINSLLLITNKGSSLIALYRKSKNGDNVVQV
ncbi:MAG: class I SAM-dependent methyltransferase [Deltaproteobacteria bacterium]|nr:class I SAM-dependent methyltransferase [Deltaproteobacteria bacterium]MCL5276222.1 class I SAM-dependent methyltransferase [Deltaproteobacteria bacterium]